jgi:hypothetical protein
MDAGKGSDLGGHMGAQERDPGAAMVDEPGEREEGIFLHGSIRLH